mmetsp:Transcript_90998/g.257086  ORF Transcript_90998/g.257086 Transcript_90998/m.257086 type:complete len:247 (-) Transcript_90998:1351-2091(-)
MGNSVMEWRVGCVRGNGNTSSGAGACWRRGDRCSSALVVECGRPARDCFSMRCLSSTNALHRCLCSRSKPCASEACISFRKFCTSSKAPHGSVTLRSTLWPRRISPRNFSITLASKRRTMASNFSSSSAVEAGCRASCPATCWPKLCIWRPSDSAGVFVARSISCRSSSCPAARWPKFCIWCPSDSASVFVARSNSCRSSCTAAWNSSCTRPLATPSSRKASSRAQRSSFANASPRPQLSSTRREN